MCVRCLLSLCTLYVLVFQFVSLKCDLLVVCCILEWGVLGFLICWVSVCLSSCLLYFVSCVSCTVRGRGDEGAGVCGP